MAEMGLAIVGIEYDQTNEAAFDEQFAGLIRHVDRQGWGDTNRIAWVGYSLGAQRSLSFALDHPELRPKLLVRLAGGWVSELDALKAQDPASGSGPSTLNPQLSTLLVHGEQDEVFPVADARRVASCLDSNGVPVDLRVLPGEGHRFEQNRLLLFREIGEYCLTHLNGNDALSHYRSILSWQGSAKPLWVYLIPAGLWVCLRVGQAFRLPRNGLGGDRKKKGPGGTPGLRWWEIGLRWVAMILAVVAVGQSALHLIPPRLAITDRTLGIARKHLVQPKEMQDFDFLAASPIWRGKRLGALLTHVELANYNRELVNWKIDDQLYRDFVLSAEIGPTRDGDMDWRRELWENFYPRVRREGSTEAAAQIIVRFLRERVTIVGNPPSLRFGAAGAEREKAESEVAGPRDDGTTGPRDQGSGRREGRNEGRRKAESVRRTTGLRDNRTTGQSGDAERENSPPLSSGAARAEDRKAESEKAESGNGLPTTIAGIWQRQITSAGGFEAIYVAALRAAGVPARLDRQGQAEFWDGRSWRPAPRPLHL